MKKKNYKGRVIGLLIIAFIALNSFLIFFDEEERVERKSYVETWSKSFTYDLFERLNVNGVFASDEENSVYFNESIGSFQEFLVEEGQSIDEGDDLYTYEVVDYSKQETQLQSEIDRLDEEIEAIEDYVDELEDFDIPDPESDDDDDSSDPPSYVETEFQQEAAVAEQEAELEKKRAMLQMVEDQLDQLEDDGQEITVTSPYDGTVTQVSKSLEAPILTLKSTSLMVAGELSEDERQLVEQDMPAQVFIPELDVQAPGTLTNVSDFPEETDSQRLSRYPYEMTLENEAENVLPGYHADVDIITDSALGAVSVLENVLVTEENLYAWVMTVDGSLERRTVETGITEDGLVEVEQGLEEGEWLADEPKDEFRNGAPFITPIHLQDLPFQRIFEPELGNRKNYGLLGLLAR
ncbi:efflux RND transporter periplasmic adaptor subunit [Halobacillus litoralis]|uniref:efflux RND transporter periplasmic adaptor subunit n=1 Tax=Halobacillus litoralis TaxID=45668 RepID=UPI001CD33688|nr:efflux RND transporter periplasmic adaptor subunit [Halobacillus litoralis]MCA0972815.1 efflux RND transporter periplasmic adaptor subunit [Halobacillus litoralis]